VLLISKLLPMLTKRLGWIALICIGVLCFWLGSLSIEESRTAARKISSANNLKQLGLAIMNYGDTFQSFPAGCDGEGKHGWLTAIQTYVEASRWYSQVDWDVSWEHPFNLGQFRTAISVYRIPGRDEIFTTEGWAVTHYAANPALLHRGRYVRFSGLASGKGSYFVVGEISTNVTPFGYPYNWRKLKYPIGDPDSFNGWSDGSQFVMGDFSVRWLSNSTDRVEVEALRDAAPLPDPEAYARPARRFMLTKQSPAQPRLYIGPDHNDDKGGASYVTVWPDLNGTPMYIDFIDGFFDCQEVYERNTTAKILRCLYPRDAAELERIISLKELEYLAVMSRQPVLGKEYSSEVTMSDFIAGLKRLAKLKVIKMKKPSEGFAELQAALPALQIIESTRNW
jgi:hypothetical protein